MKTGEIRDLNFEEMHQKVSDLKEELFNLRFQHEIGQLEDPQRMKQTKRDIARLKTIIHEVALNPKKDNE
ncbi:MAG: 50S ribosomal protein L29 [Deltaproteobacteria bacterium]|jgi:large subunit ribosomal protein L29|nr:50S ribosomal protein L29 [Deltaproteobacteria bacterium]